MMNAGKGLRIFVFAAFATGLAGCGGNIIQPLSPTAFQVQISITPNTVVTASGGTLKFTAQVTGSANTAVSFTATAGTIDATGSWTAPIISGSSPALSATVTATAAADPTQKAVAMITVTPTIAANPGSGGRAAPSGSWQPIGPPGGPITTLAADPSFPETAYASSRYVGNGGLWKTTDGGTTWKVLITNTDLDQVAVADIQVVGNTIYVATTYQRFFKSTDHGTTWVESMLSSQQSVGAMAVDPKNPSTIYLSLLNEGVEKSTDAGDNWTMLSGSPSSAYSSFLGILSRTPLMVDPRTGAVYYGTDHGLYISSDGGITWKQGMGFTGSDGVILDVAASPVSNRVFALATSMFFPFPDLYTSTDNGATWQPLATVVDAERIMPDLTNASTVYLYQGQRDAVYTSVNGGITFTPSDSGIPTYVNTISTVWGELSGAMLIFPSTKTFLVAVPNKGVYQSVNAGQSWSFMSNGLSSWFGTAVAFDPEIPTTIYFGAVNEGGLWKSADTGNTWSHLYTGSVGRISVDPFNSLHILAEDYDRGLIESQDGGSSWYVVSFLNTNPNPFYISGISFNPLKSGTIYISVNDVNGVGILVSKDSGQTYVPMGTGITTGQIISPVAVNPTDGTMLFVGTGQGIFKSTDGGATWSLKSPATVSLISVDAKSTPPVLYGSAGTSPGTSMKSMDLGETWKQLPGFQMVITDPSTANSLFTPNAWSADGGTTWQWILTNGLGNISLNEAYQFNGLVLAPSSSKSPETLYMISNTYGLFRFVVGP